MEQFGPSVPALRELEQLRRLINKVRRIRSVNKLRTLQHIFQKGNIGLDTADAKFLQTAQHLGDGDFVVQSPGSGLNQQRIIIGGDYRAGKSVPRIQTDPHAAAAAIGDQLTGIRHKPIGRVFRSNTALNGFTPVLQIFLFRNPHFRTVEAVPFRNTDLGLYNINAGNGFRNGMFYLNTGIHFNEVIIAIPGHQKFYRTGAEIVDIFHERDGRATDFFPQGRIHKSSRRHLHHFLVTALDGAVPFEQVHHFALFIGQDLHFNMLGILQIFFQINLFAAKGFQCLGFSQGIGCFHFGRAVDSPHPAAATAIDCFDDDRIAIGFAKIQYLFHGRHRTVATGNHGDSG